MEIRKKLLYQFIGIVALILLLSCLAIYFSFSRSRKEDFYDRLGSKAKMVSQMLIEIEEIDAELLKRIEKNNPVSLPDEKIIIYDYKDSIVYSTDTEKILEISPELIDEVRLNDEVRLKQKSYEILGQFYTDQYDRFVVFAAASDIFGIGKLKRLRIILLIVFLVSLIIVLASGRIFVQRSLKPISDIMAQVSAISEKNIDARISDGNGKDELAQLAQTFNKMLERLETAFKTQKNFIANASHELRTPLTVITGHLEVTLMKARENEEYRKTIVSVLDNIKNLNSISNRLLLLAQASSDFSDDDFDIIRIDDVIWKARNEILKIHDDFKININFGEKMDDESKLKVKGNELLLKTAVTNLIENGCKYSSNRTSDILFDSSDNMLILYFSDKGIGIPERELKMIFQPFYRATNSGGSRGHGIGLSLVEKIISLHKGEIRVNSEIMRGSNFIISLPLYS